jgi:hypothetical protein
MDDKAFRCKVGVNIFIMLLQTNDKGRSSSREFVQKAINYHHQKEQHVTDYNMGPHTVAQGHINLISGEILTQIYYVTVSFLFSVKGM